MTVLFTRDSNTNTMVTVTSARLGLTSVSKGQPVTITLKSKTGRKYTVKGFVNRADGSTVSVVDFPKTLSQPQVGLPVSYVVTSVRA